MNDTTGRWLEPMLEAVDDAELTRLARQSSMPSAEADSPALAMLPEVPGVEYRAVDWIRFGQLLRQHLGWDDYPDAPDEEEGDR
jgi:hypothetical protein